MFKKPSLGFLFSISGSFLWAIGIVISRFLLLGGEDPLNLVIWINLLACPLWFGLFTKHKKEFFKLRRRDYITLIVIGIAGSIGLNLLQAMALKNTTAVNFSFLYRTVVIFTIILAWIFFKEKITFKKIILSAVILIGSYFLTTKGQAISLQKGDIYTILMALSAAFIGNILVKHTVSKMHPDLSVSVTMIITSISLVVMGILKQIITFPSQIWWIVAGALIIFFQLRCRNRAYVHATASFVSMIYCFTPLFVTLFSFPLLGERLDLIQITGGLLIVFSGVLAEKMRI